MFYPSATSGQRRPEPEDIEVGITVIGSVRTRCLYDPDWGSVICMRIAPGEPARYLGVLTGADTDTPNLRLVSEERWRFPTPEIREEMRQSVAGLYRNWRSRHAA